MDINREASDKHKGVTLQKLRAIQLTFEKLTANPQTQVHVAIEHEGDVFIYSDHYRFLEENKNYDSKNFSFLSAQVLNTLVYFLDYWLKDNVQRSINVFFTFYSTNKIAKERNSDLLRTLGCVLPDKPILGLLKSGEYGHKNTLEVCRKAVLNEYKKQYKETNHYKTIEAFADEDWISFFNQIVWDFEMPANSEIKKAVHDSICRYAQDKRIDISGKEEFIEAMLRMRLEDKQEESDSINRYLTSESVELIFYRIINNPIDKKLYRFVDIDFTELRTKLADFSYRFLLEKYNSISSRKSIPEFLDRKVKQHSSELKIHKERLEDSEYENSKSDIILGTLNTFVSAVKPNFLFGEIGGGKSSLIAKYAVETNKSGVLCILIPVNYVKGKIDENYSSLYNCIDRFIESNIILGGFFKIEFLLNNTSITIAFDGLDELSKFEARNLTRHLEQLNQEEKNVTVLASGRPLELQSIISFNNWNCLTTLDLTEKEILWVLKNEASCSGLAIKEALTDAEVRLEFLKSREELYAIAKTPLVICMIRDFLNADVDEHSLGSLMYKVLTKRLEWDETDLKSNYRGFLEAFPTAIEREKIISHVAEKIFTSEKKSLSIEHLLQIITDIIKNENIDRKIVTEAISFYKNVFLQETGGWFSFISQPLLETAYAVKLAAESRRDGFVLDLGDENWRVFSFAVAINRIKGFSEEMMPLLKKELSTILKFENNTAVASIIITESQSSELALLFISKVSELSFRPLRVFGDIKILGGSDFYSPYTLAYTISLAKEKGIEWFFAEYLDPIHPFSNDGHAIEEILANMFSINNYKFEKRYLEELFKFFEYHLISRTIACSSLLPVLSLVLSVNIEARDRCLLLCDILYHRTVGKEAKELLLIEAATDNINYVREGLEIVSSKYENRDLEAVLLWFQIHNEGESFNDKIVNAAVKIAAKDHDLVFSILEGKIGRENLHSFLRFNALNNTKEGADSAVLLYSKFAENDFYLIAKPLLSDTDINSFKDVERRKILEDVLFKFPDQALNIAINWMPTKKGKDEITEIFIYNFNKLLLETDDILKYEFLHVITYFPDYPVLIRYPEIRDSYKKLLDSKPQYSEFLRQVLDGLDFRLRQNANSILLCCYPENSKSEIESVIRSAYLSLGTKREWLLFCMKLSFSKDVLDYIYTLLPSLLKISQFYALSLLYKNHYNLSKSDKDTLVEGLCGEGYFLDLETHFNGNNFKRIAGDPEFFPKLIEILNSEHEEDSKKAADILLREHSSLLTKEQYVKCLILRNDYFLQFFFEFDRFTLNLFNDQEFAAEFDKVDKKLNKNTLLGLYKKVVIDGDDRWIEILKKMAGDHQTMMDAEYQFFYNWLITLRKKRPQLARMAGDAAKKLMDFPIIKEDKDYGASLPFLAVIAAEFSDLNSDALKEILENYNCQEETVCSILRRLDKIPKRYNSRRAKDYLTVFATNKSRAFNPIEQQYLEKFLYDAYEIPKDIIFTVNSILINGTPINEKKKDSVSNKMKALIHSLIFFSRSKDVDFDLITSAMDKVGLPWYKENINHELREAVYIIKEINLSKNVNKDIYAAILKSRIENNSGVRGSHPDDDFLELLKLDVPLNFNIVRIILNDLLQKTYLFKLSLMFEIFRYTVEKISSADKAELSKEIKSILESLINSPVQKEEAGSLNQLMWMMSLISFYIDDELRDYSLKGYLKGLESLFISPRENFYKRESGEFFAIRGRSLIFHSDVILEHINPDIFQQALQRGSETGTPEIKAICRMFRI